MNRSTARSKSPFATKHAFAKTLKTFVTDSGIEGGYYSLPALAKIIPNVARLPVSLRIVLESVLRLVRSVSPAMMARIHAFLLYVPCAMEMPLVATMRSPMAPAWCGRSSRPRNRR